MPDESPRRKKPLVSRRVKRSLVTLALFLSLPMVLLGVYTQQNTKQQAAEITEHRLNRSEKPNIILIQTENQRADTLDSLPAVQEILGGLGVTFTRAVFPPDGSVVSTELLDSLRGAGYMTEEIGGETQAASEVAEDMVSFINAAQSPYFLQITMQPRSDASQKESCMESPDNPAVNEADVSDKPRYIRSLPRLSAGELQRLRTEKRLQGCGLRDIDRAVFQMVTALGEEKQNTVIVYAGKHGYSWGEHRITGSECVYEACLHVPLVISYPRLTPRRVSSDDVVTSADLTTTIAALAGVERANAEGESLVPVLLDPRASVREEALIRVDDVFGTLQSNVLRTKEWKYIEHDTGERELYDLVSDPHELRNEINNRNYKSIVDELSVKLKQQLPQVK